MEAEDLVSSLPGSRASNRVLFIRGSSSSPELESVESTGVVSRDEVITLRLAAILERLETGDDVTFRVRGTLSETSEDCRNSEVFNRRTKEIPNGYDILFRRLLAKLHSFPSLLTSAFPFPLLRLESQRYPET